MHSSALHRLFVLAMGLVVSHATAGLAVAHGVAHHELAEHALGHDALARHAAAADVADEIGPADHHQEHGHPAVDPGVSSRSTQWPVALSSPVIELGALDHASHDAAAPPPTPCESPPETCAASAAQPRAPPLL